MQNAKCDGKSYSKIEKQNVNMRIVQVTKIVLNVDINFNEKKQARLEGL